MSKISIITPFFNTEKYLARCIESVLNQSHQDIEFILVNDGSFDNSLAIAKSFAENDNRIIIITQKNQGQSVARNNGIAKATGNYLAFLDSDDFWDKNKLKEQLKFIEDNKLDGCFVNYNALQKNGIKKISKKFEDNHIVTKEEIATNNCISGSCSSILFKKELINNTNLFVPKRYNEDYDLWLRIIFNENKIGYLNKVLLTIDETRLSSSDNSIKMFFDHYYFLFKHLPLIIKKINPNKINHIINTRLGYPLFYVSNKPFYKVIYYTCKVILLSFVFLSNKSN